MSAAWPGLVTLVAVGAVSWLLGRGVQVMSTALEQALYRSIGNPCTDATGAGSAACASKPQAVSASAGISR